MPLARIVAYAMTLSLALPICTVARAQSLNAKKAPAKAKPRPAPKKPATPPPPASFAVPLPADEDWSSLEQNAPNQEYQALDHFVGLVLTPSFVGPGGGLEYIYTLSDFIDVGANLLRTRATLSDTKKLDGASEFIDADLNHLRLFGRYMSFRELYMGLGFTYSQVSGQYGWKGKAVNGEKIDTDFTSQVGAVDLFIGSEWNFASGLYVGADWVGYAVPVFGKIEYDADIAVESTTNLLSGSDPSTRIQEELTAQLKFHYLSLRVGYAF